MIETRHGLCGKICELSVEEPLKEGMGLCGKICELNFVEEPLKKRMGLVRGYVIPCERRHAKRHVLGERMKELPVEKRY